MAGERLARMHDVMAGYVERGEVPGLVTLVIRRGQVSVDAIGTKVVGGSDPVERDTIFRISSMTKPITAAATMILVEECKLRVDEPVDRLLPELADRTVLKRIDGPIDDTAPANRPITVRDLVTFRMGFGIVMSPAGTYPIQGAMDELRLGQGPPQPSTPPAPDEWIRRLVGAHRKVRVGRRPGLLLAFGPTGRHGHHPDDTSRLDLSQSSRRLSRLLDLGLPGDRRLTCPLPTPGLC